jgi:hypothetical protein
MGPTPLSTLVETFGGAASPTVTHRVGGAWKFREGSFGEEVLGLATALNGYGLGVGSCAAVLGPEGWGTLRDGLAVIVAGGTLLPLDPRQSEDVLCRSLARTGAVQAIVSDEVQLARILALRPELPALDLVLLSSAAPSERKPAALLVEAAITVGAASLAADPGVLSRALAEGEGGTACLLADAAGETRSISRAALFALSDLFATALALEKGKTVLCGLPVGGIERLGAAIAALSRRAALLLPDPAERPDSGLDQRPADVVLMDPGGLARLHRAWLEDIDSMSWFGRRATRWALRRGPEPIRHGWKHRVAETIALRGLRDKLGGKTAGLDIIGAPAGGGSAEVESFFAAVGLAVRYHDSVAAVSLAR